MAKFNAAPPQFKEDSNWLDYKKEIEIWQSLTELSASKQGPALFLSLSGKAKEAALELEVSDIKKEDGVATILTRLDKLFLQDLNQSAYLAYDRFEKFQRPENMNMMEYLIEFEKRYNKIKAHQLILPDGILAYRVLESANLNEQQKQLARATLTELKFNDMVKQLKKIFGDSVCPTLGNLPIKVEPVFLGKHEEETFYGRTESRGRGTRARGRVRGRGTRRNVDSRNVNRFLNPPDSYGKTSKCIICESIYHWARQCPHAYENQEKQIDTEINLFQSSYINQDEMNILVGESLNCAILDSGCTQTVCGQEWLKCFKESLSELERDSIVEKSCNTSFKFGDGRSILASTKVIIPTVIGNQKVKLETHVIDARIPLLLSKSAMKKAQTVLNFTNDSVSLFGHEEPLLFTSSGHYCIPICNSRREIEEETGDTIKNEISLLSVGNKSSEEIVTKLHKQFCHCSADKLKKLLKTSGLFNSINTNDIVDQVVQTCHVCKIYKRAAPRPVVGLPLASEWNHTVAMDLISFKPGIWILHLIDVFSRYSAACIRRSKDKDGISNAILKVWISYFGQPNRFLADNGGEFSNDVYKEMCEQFNIEMATTAAESPWSNGLCERHNGVLKVSLNKIIEDTHCSLETALSWAVAAKNSLHGHNGFSPNQIVFGRNPSTPNVLQDKLPALEGEVSSRTVAENLNAMHKARESFMQCESSEKVRRALRHNVRTCNDAIFNNGDKVYYKRNDSNRWHGPGTVIGQEHKQVLVKHGGTYVRVHCCRLIHVDNVDFRDEYERVTKDSPQPSSLDNHSIEDNCFEEDSKDADSLGLEHVQEPVSEEEVNQKTQENSQLSKEDELSNEMSSNAEQLDRDGGHNTGMTPDGEQTQERAVLLPKVKATIRYKLKEVDEWKQGFVHSRAGKIGKGQHGKHKHCLNILNPDTGDVVWLDFKKDVDEWEPVLGSNEEEILLLNNSCNTDAVYSAKQKEMQNWIDNDVYLEVDDIGQPCISTRWVVTTKDKGGSKIVKARLVARGFEDDQLQQLQKDSPTCTKESLRFTLSIIASNNWKCNTLDVKAAFLQGSDLKRDVFLRPPQEANTNQVWKLRKCVYGLADASRNWYMRVKKELQGLGVKKSSYDDCLFYFEHNKVCQGIIVIHVDDFLWGGTSFFEENVINKLRRIFTIGSEEHLSFKYIGMNINQEDEKIKFNQQSYVDSVEPMNLQSQDNNKERELDPKEQSEYRALCGSLNWIASQSRPDIAFDVCQLSTKLKSATVADVFRANKTVKKLKQNQFELSYIPLHFPLKLAVFCDASYANLPNGGSQGGIITFLMDSNKHVTPIYWSSRKLRRVVRSTLAAETMVLLDAVDSAVWLIHIFNEILNNSMEITTIFTDNMSLIEAVHSTRAVEEKRLRVDIAAIRESVLKKEVSVQWIPGKDQLADVLTKQGSDTTLLLKTLKASRL